MDIDKIIAVAIWAAVIVLPLIVEVFTVTFYGMITSFSAAVPFVISFFLPDKLYNILSVAIFVVIWFLLLWLTFRVFKLNKRFRRKLPEVLDQIMTGKRLLIEDSFEEEQPNFHFGYIKFQGKTYPAVSAKGEGLIPKGTEVTVTQIVGNKLIVKKARN